MTYFACRNAYAGGKVARCQPSRRNWQLFRKALERVAPWNWEAEYQGEPDGPYWHVDIEWGDRSVHSSGAGALPTNFSEFCEAVSRLLGFKWPTE